MAARSKRAGGRPWPAVAVMIFFGSITFAGGLWQLQRLKATHQADEVLYSVSPRILQAWLKSIDPVAQDSPGRLADRFLLMTLPQRRDAIIAMANVDFYSKISKEFDEQQTLKRLVLRATLKTLAQAPALGELWFLAGRLHSQLYGSDSTAQKFFAQSYQYAPREVDIVLARLEAMGLAWPLLSNTSRDIIRRDFAVVQSAYPNRAEELKSYLAKAGAQL
jgi:hypothetical protein